MTAYEYLNALRDALEVLPDDERANAIRYYEEYFLDAGPENEARVIEELGTPGQVAQNILNEYTEIARAAPRPSSGDGGPVEAEPLGDGEEPPRAFQDGSFVPPRRSPLVTLLAVCGALFLAVTIGAPLLAGLVAAVFGLAAGAIALLAGLAVMLAAVLVVLPLAMIVVGFVLCVFAMFLWGTPASAILTLGVGLVIAALGLMLAVGCMKLCAVSFRPLLRAGGWCVEQCGRFCRWCVDMTRRFLDRLRGV